MLAATLLFAACEGENLFQGGPVAGGTPEILELQVRPQPVRSGDALDVRVVASSLSAIGEVSIGLRRGMTVDTVIEVDPARQQVTQDVTFRVPAEVSDTIIIVQATVRTEGGAVSEIVSDTVLVSDLAAPNVTLNLLQDEAGAGDSVEIIVQATDNVRLSESGFVILNAEGDTVVITTAAVDGARSDSVSFFFEVPDSIPASQLSVFGIGRDFQGLEGRSAPQTLAIIDRIVNLVQILQPQEGQRYPLDDSIEVVVRAEDRSGIREIMLEGFAVRGEPELGTDTTVVRFARKTALFPSAGADTFPKDTLFRRFLIAVPDTARENVHIVARVLDVAGNTLSDTTTILVGGPRVVVLNPGTGGQIQANRVLGVRVQAVDGLGITRVRILAEGAVTQTIVRDFTPAADTAVVDTTLLIPATAQGTLTIRAEARNTVDDLGESDLVSVEVVQGVVADTVPPELRLALAAGQRLELTDSLEVSVVAKDNSGIARVGLAAIGTNDDQVIPLRPRLVRSYSPSRTGEVLVEFGFTPESFVDALVLPDTVTFQIFAFAVDEQGNCAAAVSNQFQSLQCDEVSFPGDTTATGVGGLRTEVVAVSGRTIGLPDGGVIADARVDVARSRLYLSNFSLNKVDVLNLVTEQFERGILVGSQPWGMDISAAGDVLYVANSGGTNISVVGLDGTPAEIPSERIFTPNEVLFDIREQDDNGRIKLVSSFIDFSDRPMFIVEDAYRNLVYSTRPTPAAEFGSIRVAPTLDPSGSPLDTVDVRFMVLGDAVNTDVDDAYAVARADSMAIANCPGTFDHCLVLFDHIPGQPGSIIQSDPLPVLEAGADLLAKGSDVFVVRGQWIPDLVGLSDTTFVSGSGNRRHVAFGEGGVDPHGRIVLWHAAGPGGQGALSPATSVADIVSNASERVNGVGLNQAGDLGVARGQNGAYFFTGGDDPVGDLRLQGFFESGLQNGGAGATFHPQHTNARQTGTEAMAFVGTSRRTIKAINTFHFFEMGEIHIRDNIVGPLRAALPLPGDPADVILKLFGVTDAGGVVIIDVRAGDVDTQP